MPDYFDQFRRSSPPAAQPKPDDDYFEQFRSSAAAPTTDDGGGSDDDYFDQFRSTAAATQATEPNDGGIDVGGAVLGAAAVAGTAALGKKFGWLGPALDKANNVRRQLMLTGLAAPKSVLGNTGAVIAHAAETRSLNPLKEFFSGKTVRDAARAFRTGGSTAEAGQTTWGPGRAMGAMDEATRNALQRAGMTADDAEAAVFQQPLQKNYGPFAKTLDSRTADYLVPFRRTPLNAFAEGMKTFKPDYEHKGVRNAYMAAGGVLGAATSDEPYPVSAALATALAAKYGVPFGIALIAARKLSGGDGGGVAGSMLPISEYGLDQSIDDPTAPFVRPAASRFFE